MVKKGHLTAKQASFIEYYCNPKSISYNNAYQSAIRAGYVATTANQATGQIVGNSMVKAAIKAYEAKTLEETEHDYDQALKELRLRLTYIEAAASKGNVQAVQVQLAILREIDEISGLRKQIHVDETEQVRELTKAESEAAEQIAAIANRQGIKLKTG